jgi:hypothetical protein
VEDFVAEIAGLNLASELVKLLAPAYKLIDIQFLLLRSR